MTRVREPYNSQIGAALLPNLIECVAKRPKLFNTFANHAAKFMRFTECVEQLRPKLFNTFANHAAKFMRFTVQKLFLMESRGPHGNLCQPCLARLCTPHFSRCFT